MSCEATEPPRGAFKRGKRGAIVYENEHGTLETNKVQQGRGTFWGSCIVNGAERVRKMSGEKQEVCARWVKWQASVIDDAAEKERNGREKEKSANDGKEYDMGENKGLDAITAALERIADALELIALKEPQAAPSAADDSKATVAAFCAAHDGREFINRTTSDILADVAAWCKANGKGVPSQRAVTFGIKEHYADVLEFETTNKGTLCRFKR